MTRATALHIDLSVISANVSTLRQRIGAQKFMAVVKADAYGHGAVRVAQHIETDVDALAVAITEEAIALREAGVVRAHFSPGRTAVRRRAALDGRHGALANPTPRRTACLVRTACLPFVSGLAQS